MNRRTFVTTAAAGFAALARGVRRASGEQAPAWRPEGDELASSGERFHGIAGTTYTYDKFARLVSVTEPRHSTVSTFSYRNSRTRPKSRSSSSSSSGECARLVSVNQHSRSIATTLIYGD